MAGADSGNLDGGGDWRLHVGFGVHAYMDPNSFWCFRCRHTHKQDLLIPLLMIEVMAQLWGNVRAIQVRGGADDGGAAAVQPDSEPEVRDSL